MATPSPAPTPPPGKNASQVKADVDAEVTRMLGKFSPQPHRPTAAPEMARLKQVHDALVGFEARTQAVQPGTSPIRVMITEPGVVMSESFWKRVVLPKLDHAADVAMLGFKPRPKAPPARSDYDSFNCPYTKALCKKLADSGFRVRIETMRGGSAVRYAISAEYLTP